MRALEGSSGAAVGSTFKENQDKEHQGDNISCDAAGAVVAREGTGVYKYMDGACYCARGFCTTSRMPAAYRPHAKCSAQRCAW